MNSDLPPAGGPSPASTDTTPVKGIQDFFSWIRAFGIYRPDDGRWGAGVAAALSRRWGIDPILVRGAFVALTFAGGLGVAAYGILWLLMPQQNGRIHLQEAMHGHFTAGFIGAVLLSLALFGDPGPWGGDNWWGGPPRFLAVLFLIGLIWWMHRHQNDEHRYFGPAEPVRNPREPGTPAGGGADHGTPPVTAVREPLDETVHGTAPPVPPVAPSVPWTPPSRKADPSRASRRITRVTLGLALLAAAAVIIGKAGDPDQTGLIAGSVALLVIAAGVMVAGFSGRRSGGLALLGLLTAFAVLIGAGVQHAGVRTGQNTALVGDHTWTPSTPTQASRQYNLGAGQMTLRLTDPLILSSATAANPLHVSVCLGAGQLTLVTPQNVPVSVHIALGAGQLVAPDGVVTDVDPGNRWNDHEGGSTTRTTGPASAPVIIVDVQQGVGEVRMDTAPAATTAVPSGTPSARSTAGDADDTDDAKKSDTKETSNA